MVESSEPPVPDAGAPDLDDPEQLLRAVQDVSLRLLAGGVSASTMSQLQRMLRDNVGDFPWREVTARVLAEPVDQQRLVQQGLAAQRDWIWRGGRERPGPSLGRRAKGLLAKICAQTIFLTIWAAVLVIALIVLKHGTGFDVYDGLEWLYQMFPAWRPQ